MRRYIVSKMNWDNKIQISPSLITLDLCNLSEQVKKVEQAGIEMLHIDILDGYFSPSLPIGLDVVRQLRKVTDLAFDVHLMAAQNDFFIDELLDIGVQQLIFHAETERHIDYQINRIHEANSRAGIALKPATSLHVLDYVLDKCDTVLLMLINPGYASSKSERRTPYGDKKIRDLRQMIKNYEAPTKIEIDGRVSMHDIQRYGKDEVDIFVVGSTCMNRNNIADSVLSLKKGRREILGE